MMSTDKLTEVRAQADQLGIKYHHRAGVEKIEGLINAYLVEHAGAVPTTVEEDPADRRREAMLAQEVIPKTAEEYKKERFSRVRRKVGSLRRVRIQCMNPAKSNWPGEIISVGSAKLGTFKKYIPFNGEPYHIPQIIYDVLKEKKCSVFYDSRDRRGNRTRKSRLINEYAIEDLPALSKQELSDLARKQAMASGQGHVD